MQLFLLQWRFIDVFPNTVFLFILIISQDDSAVVHALASLHIGPYLIPIVGVCMYVRTYARTQAGMYVCRGFGYSLF